MTPDLDAIDHRLTQDMEFFCEHANITIKDKSGNLVPFRFNTAQKYIHSRLEEQKRKFGYVRALLVKGRQQGGSTYIEARNFHAMMRGLGCTAFILAHEAKATDHLFGMVRRFYDNMDSAMKPKREKDNPREMTFPNLNADYSAATAKNEDAGRSFTAQRIHWSEVAYCENAYQIQDSGIQGVALLPDTEVVFESTANGPKGLFYDKVQAALRGEGDYILIFVPWFWQEEYERIDDGSPLTEDEQKYLDTYLTKPFPFSGGKPISLAKARRKLLWRRATIYDLAPLNPEVGASKFRAIYPANPVEAFLSTGVGEIRENAIVEARSNHLKIALDPVMPRIGALDPAGEGKRADRSIYAVRQGSVIEKVWRFAGLNSMELVGRMARLLDDDDLDMLFIDNGYGKSIVDRLHELGFGRRVMGVWFNQQPSDPNKYTNKRSEIILTAAAFFNAGGVSIPNLDHEVQIDARCWACSGDEIHADLAALPMHRETSDGKHQVPSKEEIVKILGRSNDIMDACGLLFSFPVHRPDALRNTWRNLNSSDTMGQQNRNKGSVLKSLAKKRRGYAE